MININRDQILMVFQKGGKMVYKIKPIILMTVFFFLFVSVQGCARCVKFNNVPASVRWGTPAGNTPGQVVHSEDGISVSVREIHWSTTQTHFGETRIGPSFTGSSGQSINTRDITLEFDFSALSFSPSSVELKFRDTGGSENISVNGGPVQIGELANGSSGMVSWTVVDTPEAGNPHNRVGTLTLGNGVSKLQVGGQEFWIDYVCAKR